MLSKYLRLISTSLFAINVLAISSQANGSSIQIESVASKRLMRDTIVYRMFNEGKLVNTLNATDFDFMEQKIKVRAEQLSDRRVRMFFDRNLDLTIFKKSEGGFLFGGSGEVKLTYLKFHQALNESEVQIEFTTVGDSAENREPAIRISIEDPNFLVSQRGKVVTKKHFLFFSDTDTDYFSGRFTGLKWSGVYQLRKYKEDVNGQEVVRVGLKAIEGTARIGSRVFGGSGIPEGKFLVEYGDRIEDKMSKLLLNSFERINFGSGEGVKVASQVVFQRSLSDIFTQKKSPQNNMGMSFSVDVAANERLKLDDCGRDLVPPEKDSEPLSREILGDQDPERRLLRTSVPFALLNRIAYLRGRAGAFCATVSDGNGGSIEFTPKETIRFRRHNEDKVAMLTKFNYIHRNSKFGGVVAEGSLVTRRIASVDTLEDKSGRTISVFLQGTTDDVSGGSNEDYREAMRLILKRVPMKVALPGPQVVGPYYPAYNKDQIAGRGIYIQYRMLGDQSPD